MFRNKSTCPSCSQRIDALDVDCPYCHTHNVEYDKIGLSPNAINVKWIYQLIFFLVGWLGLQIIGTIVQVLTLFIAGVSAEEYLTRIDLVGMNQFVIYGNLFLVFAILLFFSKGYKQLLRPLKSWKTYVFGIVGFGAALGLSIGWGAIQSIFNDSTSANQSMVKAIVLEYPALSIVFLCFVGPICEELTYRVGMFGLLRRWNRVAAYLISIFVFAFIHFDVSTLLNVLQGDPTPLINELWNFPSYLIGGAVLVTIYDFFGFGASSIAHILNNLISILMIIFTRYAGQ